MNSGRDTAYSKEEAAVYDERRFGTRQGKLIHETEWKILEHVAGEVTPGAAVLEVGCGTGRLSVEISRKGFHTVGVDLSKPQLEQYKAKVRGGQDGNPLLGDATNLPLISESFDLVYCMRLLNQLDDRVAVTSTIGEMLRVAKPNGYVLVEFVNRFHVPVQNRRVGGVKFRPNEMKAIVEHQGGDVISVRGRFFWGIGAILRLPPLISKMALTVDNGFSRLLPRLSTRCYVLAKKASRT